MARDHRFYLENNGMPTELARQVRAKIDAMSAAVIAAAVAAGKGDRETLYNEFWIGAQRYALQRWLAHNPSGE